MLRGLPAGRPAERGGFAITASAALAIAAARAISYGREQRRFAPPARSVLRRVRHAPRDGSPRVHHFLPGIAAAFASGAFAILARDDGREVVLGVPFGAGVGLTLDEIVLLVESDNPYWGSERLAMIQGGAMALSAGAFLTRCRRRSRGAPGP